MNIPIAKRTPGEATSAKLNYVGDPSPADRFEKFKDVVGELVDAAQEEGVDVGRKGTSSVVNRLRSNAAYAKVMQAFQDELNRQSTTPAPPPPKS